MTRKLLVVAIDGATFSIIDPLIEQGQLPNLGWLIKNGVRGQLRSTVPPVTAPAWAAFMTGLDPARSGIIQFRRYDLGRYSAYADRLVSSADIRGSTFLELLSRAGARVFSVGLPMTYPPFAINGVMISGFPTPRVSVPPVFPGTDATRFEPWNHVRDPSDFRVASEEMIRSLNHWAQKYAQASKVLLREHEFDLFVHGISNTDHVSHLFWRYMDDPGASGSFRRAVADQYALADRTLGELLELAPSRGDLTVVVVSDHGFGPSSARRFNTNAWLRQQGLLAFRATAGRAVRSHVGDILARVRDRIPRTLWESIGERVPAGVKERVYAESKGLARIDWERTTAYRIPIYANVEGINVNVRGRQEHGAVEPGAEHEGTMAQIIDALADVETPTGEKLVEEIGIKENVYAGGSHHTDVPDIIVRFGNDVAGGQSLEGGPFDQVDQGELMRISGQHRMDGVFIASGRGIRKGGEIEGARILDLAPTLLALAGYPIPPALDGRVLDEVFDENGRAERPISPTGGEALAQAAGEQPLGLTAEEERSITEKLEGLGYI